MMNPTLVNFNASLSLTLVNGIKVATTGTSQRKQANVEVRYESGEPVRWNQGRLNVPDTKASESYLVVSHQMV